MKFIIDADCARSIGHALKAKGHDVADIRDRIPGAADEQIYDLIQKESRILITKDLDFSNTLRFPPTPHCGIILLRVFLFTVSETIARIENLLSEVSEKDLMGSLTVVRRDRHRIRRV